MIKVLAFTVMVLMARSNALMDDDFVLTISDNELDVPDWDAEAERSSNDESAQAKNSKKRKRATQALERGKSTKKQKNDKKSGPQAKNYSTEEINEASSGEEGFDDGAFDPNFEFSIEGGANGTTERFDGWDLSTLVNGAAQKTKASSIGIDEIIARRKERNAKVERTDGLPDSDHDDDRADGDFVGFGDEGDEFLADDGFGMGALPEAEEDTEDTDDPEEEEGSERGAIFHGSEDEDDENEEEEEDDEDDDDDEVAAPVPHPDDALPDASISSDEEGNDITMTARQKAFFAPEEQDLNAKGISALSASFQTMSLSRPILKGLTAIGFTNPTPIQLKTIPMALLGKDLVGGAVTGSGKTAAFVIPILERLLYRPKKVPTTRVAILMPTRELAVQCYSVATKLASFTDISFALIVGGLSLREQEQTLKKRPDVVIATPGRFIDHMRNSASFAVENLEILVLDEADRMLEDGFADELNEILKTIPKSRQTMLFSATMTQDVDALIRAGLNRPVRLMVDAKKQTVQGLVQEFIKIKGGKAHQEDERRLAYLLHLCSNIYTSKTIVFLPQKALAHRVKILFSLKNIKAAELHGSMSQEQRLAAISSFRDGTCTHLLATDLASRGLDIPRVETVVNYNVPSTTNTYLHRVGRTARAGRDGVACTIFSAAKANSSSKPSLNERTLLRPIIRIARNQSADMRTRSLPAETISQFIDEIVSLQDEIDAILLEEKEEKLLQQTERDVTKGENLVKYEEEIASRPRRTWFQSEKEKKVASELGKGERLGLASAAVEGEKKQKKMGKLSGKQKKQLLNRDERAEGGGQAQGWKKGREERRGMGVLQKERDMKRSKKQKSESQKRSKTISTNGSGGSKKNLPRR